MIFLSHIWQRGRRDEGERRVVVKESTGTRKKESSPSWLGSPCGVGVGGRQGTGEPGFGSFCEFSSAASRRGKGGVEACATDLFFCV